MYRKISNSICKQKLPSGSFCSSGAIAFWRERNVNVLKSGYMIKFEHKSDWVIDLHLHIPLPSFSVGLSHPKQHDSSNEPLHHTETISEHETIIEDES